MNGKDELSNETIRSAAEIPNMVRGVVNQLGTGHTDYPQRPGEATLEAFANIWLDHPFLVELEVPEFSSLCPKTKQPDYATLIIKYVPSDWMVESKSLKLYLFSYRNYGCFHEFIVNKIARDLFDLMKPRGILVRGDFFPRGGISINPVVELYSVLSPEERTATRELLWSK